MSDKKQKIKNPNYRKFLDQGLIDTINEDHIKQALDNITGLRGKHIKECRSFVIELYYTGARPGEVLKTKGKLITKEGSYIKVAIVEPTKNGLPRTIYLPYKKPLVKELYNYAITIYPDLDLYPHLKSNTQRFRKTKKGLKEFTEDTNKLRYHFTKWFKNVLPESISPYFLRHNRFSKLSEAGLSDQDLKMIKGSRTYQSIEPYRHMSTHSAKKAAKKME